MCMLFFEFNYIYIYLYKAWLPKIFFASAMQYYTRCNSMYLINNDRIEVKKKKCLGLQKFSQPWRDRWRKIVGLCVSGDKWWLAAHNLSC